MLNPIFKNVYSETAIEGLQFLADFCEKRGINGAIYGIKKLASGDIVPMLFVYDGEDDKNNSLYIATSKAGRIMTRNVPEDADDFCGSIVFWPKHMGEVSRGREVVGILWVI